MRDQNRTFAVPAQDFCGSDKGLPIPPAKYMQYNESAERNISGAAATRVRCATF